MYRICVRSISPELLVGFLNYSIQFPPQWGNLQRERFQTPCFKVKVIPWGQKSNTQHLCPLILRIFYTINSHLNEQVCSFKLASLQGQGHTGRSKVTCLDFVTALYHENLLWFWRYSTLMMRGHAEHGFKITFIGWGGMGEGQMSHIQNRCTLDCNSISLLTSSVLGVSAISSAYYFPLTQTPLKRVFLANRDSPDEMQPFIGLR